MMTKLFRIGPDAETEGLIEAPFVDEVGDLKSFVKHNVSILGERVAIFGDEVDTGIGRIDLLAMDESLEQGKLLLIELKNVPADTNVLLQVLRYASWISTSPDSVRLLLEKQKIRADKVDLKPRIVIVAPDVDEELVELSQYIRAFEFSFLEVKRFRLGSEFLAIVNPRLQALPKSTSVTMQEEWSWERYEHDLRISSGRLEIAKWLVSQMQEVCADKGWPLQLRFRKGYTPFQMAGSWNVMGTEWKWPTGWCIWFKLPSPPNDLGLNIPAWVQATDWSQRYQTFYMQVLSRDVEFHELEPFFDRAYEYVTGRSGGI